MGANWSSRGKDYNCFKHQRSNRNLEKKYIGRQVPRGELTRGGFIIGGGYEGNPDTKRSSETRKLSGFT